VLSRGQELVASLVIEESVTETQAIAALLHDVLEDTDATYEDISDPFGEAVADIVLACTDTTEDPKPPWRRRFTGGMDGTPWYYRTLVSIYRSIEGCDSRLIDELDRTVTTIGSLAEPG
jgi:hypothetical protein